MKKLILTGTPYEIGYLHGELGKKEVLKSLETYEKLFWGYGHFTWEEAKKRAMTHLNAIQNYDMTMIEEMKGIAAGASVSFEDVLTLNTRSEIALTNNAYDGCTAVAFSTPFSSHTWIGQNWDWKSNQQTSLLLLKIQQKNKPTITMVTEGGMIGKIGFNDKGLGVCLNALFANELDQNKIPLHLGLRAVLNSNSLTEAVQLVNSKIASTANFLIASSDEMTDKIIDLEVSPIKTECIKSNNGVLYHTNHLCSVNMKDTIMDFPRDDSLVRIDRMKELVHTNFEKTIGTIGIESMHKILSDHYNYPNSVCRHVDETTEEHTQAETIFSIMMNLTERKAFILEGQPCQTDFQEILF